MSDGVQSLYVSDALTQRQIFVERAKTALHTEHDAVMSAVIAAVILALGRNVDNGMRALSRRQLAAIVRKALKTFDTEAERYVQRIHSWLEIYAAQEASYTTGVLNNALDEEDQKAPDVWPAVLGGIVGAVGLTIPQTMAGLKTTQRNAIKQLLNRAYVQNWSLAQTITAFKGTAARKRKDGLLTKLSRAAAATVDTVVQFGMSAARLKVMQGYMDWTLGYTWVSILDARTSSTCRSLSGRIFAYGKGPVPPVHYRCRSHIMPIFRDTAKLHAIAANAVVLGETYYAWLRRQSNAMQLDVLGPTWSKLFRSGGLSADEFAARIINRRYEPLTLDELRNKSPDMFRHAGV